MMVELSTIKCDKNTFDYSKHKAYSENIWIGIMFYKKNIQGMDIIELNRLLR